MVDVPADVVVVDGAGRGRQERVVGVVGEGDAERLGRLRRGVFRGLHRDRLRAAGVEHKGFGHRGIVRGRHRGSIRRRVGHRDRLTAAAAQRDREHGVLALFHRDVADGDLRADVVVVDGARRGRPGQARPGLVTEPHGEGLGLLGDGVLRRLHRDRLERLACRELERRPLYGRVVRAGLRGTVHRLVVHRHRSGAGLGQPDSEIGAVALVHRHVLDGQGGEPGIGSFVVEDLQSDFVSQVRAVGMAVPHLMADGQPVIRPIVVLKRPYAYRSPLVPVVLGELPTDRRHQPELVAVAADGHSAIAEAEHDPPVIDVIHFGLRRDRNGLLRQPQAIVGGSSLVQGQTEPRGGPRCRVRRATNSRSGYDLHSADAADMPGMVRELVFLGVDARRGQGQQGQGRDDEGDDETTAGPDGQKRYV